MTEFNMEELNKKQSEYNSKIQMQRAEWANRRYRFLSNEIIASLISCRNAWSKQFAKYGKNARPPFECVIDDTKGSPAETYAMLKKQYPFLTFEYIDNNPTEIVISSDIIDSETKEISFERFHRGEAEYVENLKQNHNELVTQFEKEIQKQIFECRKVYERRFIENGTFNGNQCGFYLKCPHDADAVQTITKKYSTFLFTPQNRQPYSSSTTKVTIPAEYYTTKSKH